MATGVVVGCGGGDSPSGPGDGGGGGGGSASLNVRPSTASLEAIDGTVDLEANARRADGSSASDAAVSWTSSDTEVATVDGRGVVTARANGQVTVEATFEGERSEATVTVDQQTASVTLDPDVADTTLVENVEQMELAAEPVDANGHAVADADVAWSSSAQEVATVDSTGLVRALDPGTAAIVASADGAADTVSVEVTEEPGNDTPRVRIIEPASGTHFGAFTAVRFEAEAVDDEDGELDGRDVEWSSNREGRIGTGAVVETDDLADGATHEVVVTATDSEGAEAQDTVTVEIGTEPRLRVARLDTDPRGVTTEDTFAVGAVVVNDGGTTVTDVPWSVTLDGGEIAAGELDSVPHHDTVFVPRQEQLGAPEPGHHELHLHLDSRFTAPESADDHLPTDPLISYEADGEFNIELRFGDKVDEASKEAARAAADEWEEAITADLPAATVPNPSDDILCAQGGEIDDVAVSVTIDRDQSTVGQGNVCSFRHTDEGTMLTALSGRTSYAGNGAIDKSVVMHEIGHALGVLGAHDVEDEADLLQVPDGPDEVHRWVGVTARRAYVRNGGSDQGVPVDDDTSHWANSVSGSLMAGTGSTITPMSVGALGDMFYPIDMSAAGEWSAGASADAATSGDAIRLEGDVPDWPTSGVVPPAREGGSR